MIIQLGLNLSFPYLIYLNIIFLSLCVFVCAHSLEKNVFEMDRHKYYKNHCKMNEWIDR